VERVDAGEAASGLFADHEEVRQRTVDAVADEAVRRFGPEALRRGGARADGRRSHRDLTDEGPRPEAG
jgi:hypothetical protein